MRYLACVFAGYLLGLFAGASTDGASRWALAGIGLVALWLVFRQGRKSVSHAAADAVAKANARANAAAVNANHITVAGGHVVQAGQPPIEAYDRDVWETPQVSPRVDQVELVGTDPVTGFNVYRTPRGFITSEHLTGSERRGALISRSDDADVVESHVADSRFWGEV